MSAAIPGGLPKVKPAGGTVAGSAKELRVHQRFQADAEKDELYKQIGQLKVELDFLKKRAGLIT